MPTITRVDCIESAYREENVESAPTNAGFFYSPSESIERTVTGVRIETDIGITGEFVGLNPSALSHVSRFGDYLIGKDPLNREKHWHTMKDLLGKTDRIGQGPFDIALWDLAGKYYEAPIHKLLGTYQERLPAYASLYYPDTNGGLDSPEAIADFCVSLQDRGYHGAKIFGRVDDLTNAQWEIDTIHAVGDRTAEDFDLMYDATCSTETWTKAREIGKACDQEDFLWYEDPYADGGVSQHGHQLLRDQLETPIQASGELQRLEQKTDFLTTKSADIARASMSFDGGITGAIKFARVAEGLGLDIEYHLTGPYARHCGAAVRNTNYYEVGQLHPDVAECSKDFPRIYDEYSDAIDTIDDDGYVSVPTDPGIGVDFDWSYIEQHEIAKKTFAA